MLSFSPRHEHGFSKIFILIFTIIILIIAAFGTYFFTWRPSDNDYRGASGYLQQMLKSTKTISTDLSDLHVYEGLLDTKVSQPLSGSITAYSTALKSFQASVVIKHDPSMRQQYKAHQKTLDDYNSFIESFSTSMALVQSVVTTCGDMAGSLASGSVTQAFYTDIINCQNKTQTLHSSDSKSIFSKQFIDNLSSAETNKMAAYQAWVTAALKGTSGLKAADTAITKAQTEVHNALYEKVSYSGSQPQSPVSVVQSLLTTVNSQQKMFIR